MLFKEKLLLANCDSVQKRPLQELSKRFKMGLLFSEGIIVSTNVLIDNAGIDQVLSDNLIHEYLCSDEGQGRLIVRGRKLEADQPLLDLYDSLEDSFIFSSLNGVKKKDLTSDQQSLMISRLKRIDSILEHSGALRESIVTSQNNTLSSELSKRIPGYFDNASFSNTELDIEAFCRRLSFVPSRSEAYHLIESTFPTSDSMKIKEELINPAYNSLFIGKSEAIVQDRIAILSCLPVEMINGGIILREHRKKIESVSKVWGYFNFITSLGGSSLQDFLTEKAVDFVESKLEEKGLEQLSRKNWFGMYDRMVSHLGVEIK